VTILDDLGHDGVAKPLHRLSAAAGPGVNGTKRENCPVG
jgi:hypothetical protein